MLVNHATPRRHGLWSTGHSGNGVARGQVQSEKVPGNARNLFAAASTLIGFFGLLLFATPAANAAVLYDNGPANLCCRGFGVSVGFSVANSFVLQNTSSVTGANFVLWTQSGSSVTQVDWSIVGSPTSASVFGSGTASVAQNPIALNYEGVFGNCPGTPTRSGL